MDNSATLTAKADIADLIHRYALNIRSGKGPECAKLYTEDGLFETRMAKPTIADSVQVRKSLTGRDEILQYLLAVAGGGVHVCPLVHNLLIEVDGDQARSSCVMETRTWPAGNEVIGEYHDSFRRTAEGWLFQSRIFTIFQNIEA